MTTNQKKIFYFSIMAFLLIYVGIIQSWNVSLAILNMCIISAIMTIGVNIQWGYAGLFNAGIMGFTIIGGLATVLISIPPVKETWSIGGEKIFFGFLILIFTILSSIFIWKKTKKFKSLGYFLTFLTIILGYIAIRIITGDAINKIEGFEPSKSGFLGGLGLPILFSWLVGGFLAAGIAWIIGKITLGLKSDYLAIATLGIAGIILYIVKNEEWLTRGVKNVNRIPRPVPYEIELQSAFWFQNLTEKFSIPIKEASSIFVKCCYAGLFLTVLLIILWLSQKALNSPWGRMMRAIRDNEDTAKAMGKNIKKQHLLVFVLGSAVIGVAGAMMTTLEGQFVTGSYTPLRYTFVIWVMVIVGGSGNNYGSIIGGFFIWFFWVQSEPLGLWIIDLIIIFIPEESKIISHLQENVSHMRFMTMGAILLLVLRYSPKGLIPEEKLQKN